MSEALEAILVMFSVTVGGVYLYFYILFGGLGGGFTLPECEFHSTLRLHRKQLNSLFFRVSTHSKEALMPRSRSGISCWLPLPHTTQRGTDSG